jgi:outer membrane protein assembly factor BamD (BamD/ComL family)
MNKPLLTISFSIFFLSGCSSVSTFEDISALIFEEEPPNYLKEKSLNSLRQRKISSNSSQLPPSTTLEEARESYLELLKIAEIPKLIAEALQRLAELEGLMAESALFDDNNTAMVKHLEQSEAYYQRLIAEFPDAIDETKIRYQLARVMSLNGKSDSSLDLLSNISSAGKQRQEAVEARFRLAETAFSRKDFPAAFQLYNQVVAQGVNSGFHNTALYKRGWTLFKRQKYFAALDDFIMLLDHIYQPVETRDKITGSLMEDAYRVTALTLSYIDGPQAAKNYFKKHGHKDFEADIYRALAQLYQEQKRYQDTAETFFAFVETNPLDVNAPELESGGIEVLGKAGFVDLVLDAKKRFVRNYQKDSRFWRESGRERSDKVAGWLKNHLNDVIVFYHAEAQKSKKPADFIATSDWYRLYLINFPDDKETPEKRWLLAETLNDGGKTAESATEYHILAYQPSSLSKKRKEEAGYRVILGAQQNLEKEKSKPANNDIQRQRVKVAREALIDASLEYRQAFAGAKRVPEVIAQLVEMQLNQKQVAVALATARDLIQLPKVTKAMKTRAREVIANGEFDLKNYAVAEQAIGDVLRYDRPQGDKLKSFHERRAQAIYKQGEIAKQAGDINAAVTQFLRLGKVEPKSDVRANAEYDAGTILLESKDYSRAVGVLTAFANRFPKHKLAQDIPAKLIVAYEAMENWRGAAREYEKVATSSSDGTLSRTASWQAGQSWMKIKSKKAREKTAEIWKEYIKKYPQPTDLSLEARQYLVTIYGELNSKWKQDYWRKKIIAEVDSKKLKDERSRLLAANAQASLTEDSFNAFKRVKLSQPLAKSLKSKQALLKATLDGYSKLLDYGIAPLATQAGHRIGESYNLLAKSLLKSQRPKGLSELQLEEYEALLEERVYPFEDKAIAALEANIRQAHRGIWDDWVSKTLTELKVLMPARYNKPEEVEDFVRQP